MKEPLISMLEIYKPLEIGKDWMNYKIIKINDITFHHIIEKRNGGKKTIDNGAILIRQSHEYLNFLDNYYHKIYNELNNMFKCLNMTSKPPTNEYYNEINYILKKVRK